MVVEQAQHHNEAVHCIKDHHYSMVYSTRERPGARDTAQHSSKQPPWRLGCGLPHDLELRLTLASPRRVLQDLCRPPTLYSLTQSSCTIPFGQRKASKDEHAE